MKVIIVNRLVILSLALTLFQFFNLVDLLPGKIAECHSICLPILFHTPFKGAHFHATFTLTANEFSFVWNKLFVAAAAGAVASPTNKRCHSEFNFVSIPYCWQSFTVVDIQAIPCIKLKITKAPQRNTMEAIPTTMRLSRTWNANIEIESRWQRIKSGQAAYPMFVYRWIARKIDNVKPTR